MGKELIWKLVASAAVLLAIAFGLDSCVAHAENRKLIADTVSVHELVEVERNRNTSLERAISDLQSENTSLSSIIADLRAAPAEIEYITVTETVLVPSEPVDIREELPYYKQYVLDEGIVVGDFRSEGGGPPYTFTTYELAFKNTMVVSKDKTASLLQVNSSYNPDIWVEVPVDLQVNEIDDTPLFEPHVGIGFTYGLPASAYGSLYMTTIHPTDNIDLVGLRLSGNDKSIAIGLDVAGYNIGAPLPVVDDLWLYAGGQINTAATPSVAITLGTKL
jgi:hypothetical protein